nr:MAG TPA: hypothetical protein [Caudoviricetes sp.]
MIRVILTALYLPILYTKSERNKSTRAQIGPYGKNRAKLFPRVGVLGRALWQGTDKRRNTKRNE